MRTVNSEQEKAAKKKLEDRAMYLVHLKSACVSCRTCGLQPRLT